ncbi:hypothetical protein PAPYR_7790 [Paratrimastix pyriformis]|uniref:Uncharacterized protein n=1 Tax=Paratrimastix pyriformis TaxID=342808 RepID=A0ABQ8UC51_9EUKA|nr:hypothetical protein PAPYR_7790 [Paratrimastix pyriformis]
MNIGGIGKQTGSEIFLFNFSGSPPMTISVSSMPPTAITPGTARNPHQQPHSAPRYPAASGPVGDDDFDGDLPPPVDRSARHAAPALPCACPAPAMPVPRPATFAVAIPPSSHVSSTPMSGTGDPAVSTTPARSIMFPAPPTPHLPALPLPLLLPSPGPAPAATPMSSPPTPTPRRLSHTPDPTAILQLLPDEDGSPPPARPLGPSQAVAPFRRPMPMLLWGRGTGGTAPALATSAPAGALDFARALGTADPHDLLGGSRHSPGGVGLGSPAIQQRLDGADPSSAMKR